MLYVVLLEAICSHFTSLVNDYFIINYVTCVCSSQMKMLICNGYSDLNITFININIVSCTVNDTNGLHCTLHVYHLPCGLHNITLSASICTVPPYMKCNVLCFCSHFF